MEAAKTVFQNNEEVANAISDYLQCMDPTFTSTFSVRPYNRFSPVFTEWWFIPRKGGWPAYHCSKLFLSIAHPHNEYTAYLFIGFYVEKGLGQVVCSMPGVRKSHIMQNNWYWHRFHRHAENGDFDDTIKRVYEYAHCPAHIRIEAHPFNKVPEPDKDRLPSQDSIEFMVLTPKNKFEIFKPPKELLSQFKRCLHLQALAKKFTSSPDIPYFWIDLHLGVYLRYGTKGTGNWEAKQIWRNILEPWSKWVE